MIKTKFLVACLLFLLVVSVSGYLLIDRSRVISVSVSLENPQQAFSQDWPLYVYAAVPGTKLPLSSYKTVVSELPLTIKLKEDMYLLPTHTIAGHDRLIVVAKISTSGDPHQAGAADMQGRSEEIDFTQGDKQQVSVTISNDK